MRLAWLRADTLRPENPLDDTAALVGVLRSTHDVQTFTCDTSSDYSSRHGRGEFDLTVFELDHLATGADLRPMLVRHGGVLLLRSLAFPDVETLVRTARLTVVSCHSVADDLRVQCPASQVRVAATGVIETSETSARTEADTAPVAFGVVPEHRSDLLRRAVARAGLDASRVVIRSGRTPEQALREADVIVSLGWPWTGQPATAALAAMAAGKPVIVLETPLTADWPAFDPQSWGHRGPAAGRPIAVSVDPLDEEHSLVLAVKRLATDAALRTVLGDSGKAWWRAHATPARAASDWERVLSEAARTPLGMAPELAQRPPTDSQVQS